MVGVVCVFVGIEHEGEVKAVDVSGDGFKVLAGTSVVSEHNVLSEMVSWG